MPATENLVEQTLDVSRRAALLFNHAFASTQLAEIDYVSLFTRNDPDFAHLCRQAQTHGSEVFQKNGPVYQLKPAVADLLPTSVVRISNSNPSSHLLGFADFVVADYLEARETLTSNGTTFREIFKEGYSLLEVIDEDILQVGVAIPSSRLTETLMGL